MAPVSPVAQQNGAAKAKRPVPPGIQTNGTTLSASSPSPSMSAKKPPSSAKQTPTSASDRTITASTVRPVNRSRREVSSQAQGRNSRNSAGMRSASFPADVTAHGTDPPPFVVDYRYILRKFSGHRPSLVVHMHPTHFRFEGQDSMFPYKSPMRLFLEHLRARTVPHELLEYFNQANVPFYDGCLIVQVHDHKTVAQKQDAASSSSASNTVVPSSIHNYNQCLTPSPFVPYPIDEQGPADGTPRQDGHSKEKGASGEAGESMHGPSVPLDGKPTPNIFTLVLHPTQESLHADLRIKATTPRGGGTDAAALAPPSTPMAPAPAASTMHPHPAKRVKREKMELDGNDIYAAEGQILLATAPPLMLEPTKNAEETIALLEAWAHPSHSEPPPQPKTRKRTVAEMAADEAAAAEQERYMLVLDDRLSCSATGTQSSGGADGDAQTGAATFEPRFERFKVIDDIKRDQAEKKEQERIKQQENDRRMHLQRQQEAMQKQLAEQEKARREAAVARESQMRQAEGQRQAMAARAASVTAASQNNNVPSISQPPHVHPMQNGGMPGGMPNGIAVAGQSAMQNGMQGQAQPRFQAQMSQVAVSSPARQGTPQQNMSSPMVGPVAMQQTNSTMAASPPRASSVVQHAQMSVPMAHNMSARGSQQSHPSGTPRMSHATPNMAHGTPISRPAMAATPHMSHATPPNMMAQNSHMGQAMMMNSQGMSQHNPQVFAQMAAQQRAIAQQQQMAAMQNGGGNTAMNGQGISPQHQQMMQMMQRQMMMQQPQPQQQQQPQQGGMMTPQQQQQFAQYAQQLQNMQGNQLRQMSPQMQAQLQQMARMGQMGNPMQRQVSGQVMNGNNASMQAIAAMQLQQQQQQHQQHQHQHQHQQQQQQHPHPHQPPQPGQPQQMGANPIQTQIQNHARQIYMRLMQSAVAKFGGQEHVPPETMEKIRHTSFTQAQHMFQQSMAQRRAQQHMMMQQQQQQQAQQQQQQQQQ